LLFVVLVSLIVVVCVCARGGCVGGVVGGSWRTVHYYYRYCWAATTGVGRARNTRTHTCVRVRVFEMVRFELVGFGGRLSLFW
jgi:hypothetical protein